jgi:hypothetical protein
MVRELGLALVGAIALVVVGLIALESSADADGWAAGAESAAGR